MQFVGFPHFTKWVQANLSDDEYLKIQSERKDLSKEQLKILAKITKEHLR